MTNTSPRTKKAPPADTVGRVIKAPPRPHRIHKEQPVQRRTER